MTLRYNQLEASEMVADTTAAIVVVVTTMEKVDSYGGRSGRISGAFPSKMTRYRKADRHA